jgi:hypothetical protein
VILKSGLCVGTKTTQAAGDLGLDLLGLAVGAKGANALDFRSPEHVLLLELAAHERAYIAAFGGLLVIGRTAFRKQTGAERIAGL